jgi:hypothetical protein
MILFSRLVVLRAETYSVNLAITGTMVLYKPPISNTEGTAPLIWGEMEYNCSQHELYYNVFCGL